LNTLELVIRRYESSTYVWGIGAGDEATDSGVEHDMAACLQEAAACFEDKRPVRLSVTYDGTQVGTYSPATLRLDPDGVAGRIREMLERL
jgi:hypothetical protein